MSNHTSYEICIQYDISIQVQELKDINGQLTSYNENKPYSILFYFSLYYSILLYTGTRAREHQQSAAAEPGQLQRCQQTHGGQRRAGRALQTRGPLQIR